MGNNNKSWLLIFFVFSISFVQSHLQAQNETATPLLEILKNLEENFDVKFSFNQSDIDKVYLNPPDYQKDLGTLLNYLNEHTPLNFEKIDERYVIISPGSTQTYIICGKIIDAITLQPLEGASVQVNNLNLSTLTDVAGEFTLQIAQKNLNITIRFLGFENQTLSTSDFISGKPCKAIVLIPSINILQEVVLSDIFTKGISKTKEGSVRLNISNFGNLPGLTEPDILQMIQALPGIISVDETISNISIRGGTTDENLILWDDIKMYQNGHFFGMISGFNPYLTKEVTVFKNGTHARYGGSVSGVVAMHSSDEFIESHEVGMQLNMINFGTFGKIRVNDKLVMHVSGRRTFTDIFESPTYRQIFNKVFQDTEITNLQNSSGSGTLSSDEDFFFYDFSLKTIYKSSDKDSFSLNFLNIDNKLKFTETFTTSSSETSKTSKLNQNSMAGGISWQRQWNENVDTKAMTYATFYSLDASNLDIFSNQQFTQTNEVLETGTMLDLNWQINNTNKLAVGYQFTETGISNRQEVNTPFFRNYVKNVLVSHAFYLSNMFEIPSTNTSISAGLRLNHFPKFTKTLLEPRINIHQKMGNGFAIEAAFEQKSQTVTQRIDFQSDFLGVEKRRWVLANDQDVPVLTSNQFSLSFLYQKFNWLLQVEGFKKNVEGITTANQGFQNQLQFVRTTGSYQTEGVEFIVNKKSNDWSAWISYTYAINNYTLNDFNPATFPHNVDIRHQGTLATSYTFNKLKITGGMNWHTGKPFTIPLSENAVESADSNTTIVFAAPNDERIADYLRVDLSAEYNFKMGPTMSAKINAAVLNLTNRKNVLNTYFISEEDENNEPVINRVNQISLGLTPNVSLQVLF